MTAFLDNVIFNVSDEGLRSKLLFGLLMVALGVAGVLILGAVAFDVEAFAFGLRTAWALDGSSQELLSICGVGGNGLLVIALAVWGRAIADLF